MSNSYQNPPGHGPRVQWAPNPAAQREHFPPGTDVIVLNDEIPGGFCLGTVIGPCPFDADCLTVQVTHPIQEGWETVWATPNLMARIEDADAALDWHVNGEHYRQVLPGLGPR